MDFLKLFSGEKDPYVMDKRAVGKESVEEQFRFLLDHGYEYAYYQRNGEQEFVYKHGPCRIEISDNCGRLDCVLQSKNLPRENVMYYPWVDEAWKERFLSGSNQTRFEMMTDLIKEHAEEFVSE